MGLSKFRKAIGEVKDRTSISLAKVASSSDLRVAVVKATRHKACPAKEHHIQEILNIACYSHHHAASCVAAISRRLSKTKDWVVALKALILIQRLMGEGNPVLEQEIFFATKNGTHILDMSNFQDTSWANSWDYSACVRTYALYLGEQLDYRMQERQAKHGMFSYEEDEDEHHLTPKVMVVRTTPVRQMQNKQIYSRIQRLMKLLDCFLGCRPTGGAKNKRIVILALYPVVKQSFQIYFEMSEIMSVLIDRFTDELNVADSTKVYDIFCRVAKQYDELDAFYYWYADAGIARASDYPEVGKISQKKLDLMDEYIKEKMRLEQEKPIDELEPMKEETEEPEAAPEPEQEQEPEPEPEPPHLKALPSTEGSGEEKKEKKIQDIGDLLNLEDDHAPTVQEHGDKLALALFGSNPGASSLEKTGPPAWESFDESGDWETALVETASQLSTQQPTLPGGFNPLLLDGMYQQGATQAAMVNAGMMTTGSASSVAVGSTGSPATLALPAPPSANGTSPGGDPFAPSLAVAPPSYVQMSDMEKKQRLLMEEQMIWQQYQGQVALANLQYSNPYPYNMVGYTHQY